MKSVLIVWRTLKLLNQGASGDSRSLLWQNQQFATHRWYNPHRRHSALDYLSPINYERSHLPDTLYRSPTPSTETG